MNKKFSVSSLIVALIGLLVILAIFFYGASSLEMFFAIVGIGILIYIISIILCVMAFVRKENGLQKYIVVVSVIIAIFFVGYIN
ncbi:amino acid transporter [Pullulanibacillus pueri]|uniref:DUF3953 domain-containing protein n=1 Tax=Pullulanibacillus pueri TaxID=1437324 RepID=A0A8J3ENK9_9BACL|nr:hypothetical protein [Pullulanibacillus pueri]MBM7681670.1 amino acid transporter [Pullulanibacillus pueri]GGH86972.1 hypothetical protein GCM10007096_35910 [Pullulanibacillus pueri]